MPWRAALAVMAVAWLACGRVASCAGSLESPDTQIRKALARQDHVVISGEQGLGGGGTVELRAIRFDDVTVSLSGGRAAVVAMVTADGRVVWPDREAKLVYIGRERFHMSSCAGALWCSEGDQLERLRGVLLALFRHCDAVERRDADALLQLLSGDHGAAGEGPSETRRRVERELQGTSAGSRVRAWQIRVERDHADVGEDLEGGGPGQPARPVRHVYRLVWEGDRWLFAGGV